MLFTYKNQMIMKEWESYTGKNAHIDHPVALQTDHPKLLFFLRV